MTALLSPIALAEETVEIDDAARTDQCEDRLPFRDVDHDDWFQNSICSLYKKGAIDSANYHRPHNEITRMEFMKEALLMGGYQIREVGGIEFNDIDSSNWAWEVATTAHALGFMNGYNGDLRPNDPITRGEALVVMMRMHDQELWGWNDSDIYFRDVESDDFYAYATIIGWEKNIITGYADRTFQGEDNVTRAESAEIITKSEQIWPNEDFPGTL